jgi:hypothetical protein
MEYTETLQQYCKLFKDELSIKETLIISQYLEAIYRNNLHLSL